MTAGEVYRVLWRQKVLIVVLTVACVAATWIATASVSPTYTASTLVRIEQTGGNAFEALQASQLLARSYAEIFSSGALDGRVRTLVGGSQAIDVSAAPVQDLELLWISARSKDKSFAAVVANAAPRALLGFVRASKTPAVQVLTVKRATTPSSPSSPNLKLNVALALVLGLVFNSALALLIETLRDRLPHADELARTVGYPVLAAIPTLRLNRVTTVERAADTSDRLDPQELG